MEESNELCRLCGETKSRTINIFDEEGLKLAIEKKITKCLQIKIDTADPLPVAVCIPCWKTLDQFNDFHEKTNQVQISLSQLFTRKTQEFSQVLLVENNYDCSLKASNDEEENDDDDDPPEINQVDDDESSSNCNESSKDPIDFESELEDNANNDDDVDIDDDKTSLKIPDNYMTGTEADMEMVKSKKRKTRGKTDKNLSTMDRYPWLCTDCNDKLASLELLEEHHKTVHNQRAKYMCIHCWRSYDEYQVFLNHVRRHKNNIKYSCDVCKKSFSNKSILESHRASHSDERTFICPTCGKGFRHATGLYIHSRCHLPETMKDKYPCEHCGKVLSTKPNLVTHMRIHSGVKNFQCDVCGKGFLQKGNLEAHFLTHSLDRPFTCTKCDKAFKTPLQLKKHASVHSTDVKPHKCSDCGRTFREKGTLREHYRIHTGDKPFTCEVCGKTFRFKGILTTHRRQHTGERPYSCLECNHNFSNWPNYNKHMKRRHGINTSNKKPGPQSTASNQSTLSLQQRDEQRPAPVQIIQTLPQSSLPEPVVLQAVPPMTTTATTTNVPVFHADSGIFNSRDNTTFMNPVPTSIQTYLPASNIPYNFYSGANMSEGEMILPK